MEISNNVDFHITDGEDKEQGTNDAINFPSKGPVLLVPSYGTRNGVVMVLVWLSVLINILVGLSLQTIA